jgi:hypothetical protein
MRLSTRREDHRRLNPTCLCTQHDGDRTGEHGLPSENPWPAHQLTDGPCARCHFAGCTERIATYRRNTTIYSAIIRDALIEPNLRITSTGYTSSSSPFRILDVFIMPAMSAICPASWAIIYGRSTTAFLRSSSYRQCSCHENLPTQS